MAKDTEMSLVGGVPTLKTTSDNVEAFTNATDAVSVGDAVYISGNGSVATASNSTSSQEAIGLVFEVTDSTNCRVMTRGLLEGFSTGMTANTRYYLGTSGALTTTKPTNPNFAQVVGIAYNATDLFVCPMIGVTDLPTGGSTTLPPVKLMSFPIDRERDDTTYTAYAATDFDWSTANRSFQFALPAAELDAAFGAGSWTIQVTARFTHLTAGQSMSLRLSNTADDSLLANQLTLSGVAVSTVFETQVAEFTGTMPTTNIMAAIGWASTDTAQCRLQAMDLYAVNV